MEQQHDNTLPIFNYHVDDLPGEIWLPVFEFEQYALISQFGRVKRKARFSTTLTGSIRCYKERIYRPSINMFPSFKSGSFRYNLICTASAGNLHYLFNVMRMMQYVFNGAYDFHNPECSVIAINGNDLDLRPENLKIIYRQRTRESYTLERRMTLARNMTVDSHILQRRALLSCYNKEGTKLGTFENIDHAHDLTGIEVEAITQAIAEPFTLLQDCYWRNGKKKKINTILMKVHEKEVERKRNGIQLTQFDLNGIPINHYYSVREAALENHLQESEILECLDGKSDAAGYFLWKTGNWDTPISGL